MSCPPLKQRLSPLSMASSTKNDGKSKKKLTDKFLQLRADALKQGLNSEQLRQVIQESSGKRDAKSGTAWNVYAFLTNSANRRHVLAAVTAVTVGMLMTMYHLFSDDIIQTPCLIDPNIFSDEIYRPKVDCNMCRDVFNVPEERNISAEDFYRKYSFTGRPVLVKEATVNWTAMSHFSFNFFRDLYKKTKGSLRVIEEDCQFFPYETDFLTLTDALNMPAERAAFEPGQPSWYIGWSNCHEGVRKKLREHYERPYFLPSDSETVAEDWIFMGGSGPGAMIHLDYVMRPSWQAQISGTKTWLLVPSPECEAVCHSFNVTVHKGDIIVVDTNIWYHSTFVHPGEISITIGSEYD